MTGQFRFGLLVSLLLIGNSRAAEPKRDEKLVLLELFVSQGCDMCPPAERVLASVAKSDRVVPLTFHVDYFDDPWKDPYSDRRFSDREARYSRIYDRANKLNNPGVLYLTPLLMIDGQTPMLGTDDEGRGHKALPSASEAIRRAQNERPGVRIALTLNGDEGDHRRSLDVNLTPLTTSLKNREVLVLVVPFEEKIVTEVASGELGGKTYTGQNVARDVILKTAILSKSGETSLKVPVTLPKNGDPRNVGFAVLVQDDASGKVHQAAMIRWTEPKS